MLGNYSDKRMQLVRAMNVEAVQENQCCREDAWLKHMPNVCAASAHS